MAANIVSLCFLHATPFPKFSGGIDTWLINIIKQISSQHIEVTVFTPRSDVPPFFDVSTLRNLHIVEGPELPNSRVLTHFARSRSQALGLLILGVGYVSWALRSGLSLKRLGKRKDWPIIVLHTVPAMLPLVFYRILGGRGRVICMVRGTIGKDLRDLGMPWLAGLYEIAERLTMRFADRVISNGEDTARYVKERIGRESFVLPNGVDCERFGKNEDCAKSQGDNQLSARLAMFKRRRVPVIMTIGTLREIKGIRFLIEAAAHIQSVAPSLDFRVVFVGKGDPDKFMSYARSLGCLDKLVFIGERKNIAALLEHCTVAIAVSGGGGVSHALLEMMAAGRAIIAWNNLTYAQVLTDGVSAVLVKERDGKALGEGILKVLGDTAFAASLGEEARRQASRYDWTLIADRFLAVAAAA